MFCMGFPQLPNTTCPTLSHCHVCLQNQYFKMVFCRCQSVFASKASEIMHQVESLANNIKYARYLGICVSGYTNHTFFEENELGTTKLFFLVILEGNLNKSCNASCKLGSNTNMWLQYYWHLNSEHPIIIIILFYLIQLFSLNKKVKADKTKSKTKF